MTTPLATYIERRLEGRRRFELFGDRLAISGSSYLGTRFELNIPLNSLIAQPDKAWLRGRGFWSAVVLTVLFAVLPRGFDSVLSSWWLGLFNTLAATFLLLALATFRRVEWVAFRNFAGQEMVNIAKSGPNRSGFQHFVDVVSAAIRAAREDNISRQAPQAVAMDGER